MAFNIQSIIDKSLKNPSQRTAMTYKPMSTEQQTRLQNIPAYSLQTQTSTPAIAPTVTQPTPAPTINQSVGSSLPQTLSWSGQQPVRPQVSSAKDTLAEVMQRLQSMKTAQDTISTQGETTPNAPAVSPDMTKAQKDVAMAEKEYRKSLQLSPEEQQTQADLDRLVEATRKGYTGTQDKTIPMEFITGQLQSIENRALNLAEPLESKLSRLQAERLASSESSKFALERAESRLEELKTPGEIFEVGDSLVERDPITGEYKTVFGAQTDAGTGGITQAQGFVDLVQSGQMKSKDAISAAPKELKGTVAMLLANQQSGELNAKQLDKLSDANIVLNKISQATEAMEGFGATGVGGQALAWIRATPAGTLNSIYSTLKSKIGFAELQAMRDSSPTGGALGQVSNIELKLLADSIAALDVGLNEDIQSQNLTEIQEFFQDFQDDMILKYVTQNPDVTDEEIEMLLEGRDPTGFSTVAGDTNQALNRPQRNNNPGNVKSGGLADDLAIGTDEQGHLIFPDAQSGFEALSRDLSAKIGGQSRYVPANPTIAQLGKVYAEDPNWSNAVARILGVSANTRTGSVELNSLMQAIARQEGFYA